MTDNGRNSGLVRVLATGSRDLGHVFGFANGLQATRSIFSIVRMAVDEYGFQYCDRSRYRPINLPVRSDQTLTARPKMMVRINDPTLGIYNGFLYLI